MATTSPQDSADSTLKRRARRRLIGSIALVLAAVIALPMVFDEEKKPLDRDVSVQIPNQDVVTVRPPAGTATPRVVEPREPKAASEAAKPETGADKASMPSAPATTRADEKSAATDPPAPAKPESRSDKSAKPEPRGDAKTDKAPPRADAKADAKSDRPAARTEPEPKKPAEEARVKAILDDKPGLREAAGFSVQVGAFASEDKIREAREKLGGAGFRSYTEKLETRDGERTRVRAGPFAGREAAEAARDKIRALGYAGAAVVAQ